MKRFLNGFVYCLLLVSAKIFAQTDSLTAIHDIRDFQKEQNQEFKNKETSPLDPKALGKFKRHDFYEPDLQFRVVATLKETSSSSFVPMKTSTSSVNSYGIYGMLIFTMKGKSFELPVYQSEDLMKTEKYADYLFFPFTDLTNNAETYGGGRYISLAIPKQGNQILLDFNKAYNPYCAYSDRYACPTVPAENHLNIPVTAGTKFKGKK